MGLESQMTIDQTDASSIYSSSTGYKSAHVTCILAVYLMGGKAPPLIITKGKKIRLNVFQTFMFSKPKKPGAHKQLYESGSM